MNRADLGADGQEGSVWKVKLDEARKIADVFLQFVDKERNGFGLFVFVLGCSYANERRIVARMHRRRAQLLFTIGDLMEARKNMFAASLLRSVDKEKRVPWPETDEHRAERLARLGGTS